MSDPRPPHRSHEHVVPIDASPEAIWKAFTDAKELTNWFPLEAESKPGVGGSLLYGWGPELKGLCRIEVFEPQRHLRTTWLEPAAGSDAAPASKPLIVDWTIEGRQGHAVLRVVHSGFGPDSKGHDEFEGTRRGWDVELGSLKLYLERHAGKRRRVSWLRQSTALPAPAADRRLRGPGGFVAKGSLDGLGAGDRYSVTLECGDLLEGTVIVNVPPFDFAGSVDGLNHAFLRLAYETCMAGPEAIVWLATYGVRDADVDALEKRWSAALARAMA